jgi:predicted PurR-regulated permease PerM
MPTVAENSGGDDAVPAEQEPSPPPAGTGSTALGSDTPPGGKGEGPGGSSPEKFGQPGTPFNRQGPFYFGFVGAAGVLVAWNLLGLLAQLSQIFTLIAIAAFIAIGLDPLVRTLQRRGLPRGWAVAIVFLGLLGVVGGFLAAILPGLISESTELAKQLPDQVDSLRDSEWLQRLDEEYGVISNASEQLRTRLADSTAIFSLFGGLLGAGRAVISGFVSIITVLVLTLYFLASLRSIADAGYRLVPASRRQRVRLLGDEILRRIGGYVAGQVAVASLNGFLTFILVTILDLPYGLVLSIAVAILGLIPLVGATLGAIIVVIVGLFQSVQIALVIGIYYLLYQQLENYVIAPRIMAKTVAVPGAIALIAALAGAALLGVLGALLAIPVAAAILLLVQEVLVPRQEAA